MAEQSKFGMKLQGGAGRRVSDAPPSGSRALKVVLIVLAVLLAAAIAFAVWALYVYDRVYPNVFFAGERMEGLDRAGVEHGLYVIPGKRISPAEWEVGSALMHYDPRCDMLLGVGSGVVNDTCKVLAHETNRPFFTFPTIASTCAACTSLGIVYHPDGSLREYSFSKIPPNHIFINTEIIANAPVRYLWAGMGDTMAKHYECTISSRNDIPAHSDAMGIALSSMCAEPIVRWGRQAMEDCRRHRITPELTEIIEAIIISTGFVSNFVQVDYTTGMAHAMYNGFTILPSTEENHHLHGEVVSYGILVMLTADKQYEERDRLLRFNKSIGLPTCLADIHARPEDLPAVTEKALAGIDVRVWPYPVTQQMLIDAVMELEQAQP